MTRWVDPMRTTGGGDADLAMTELGTQGREAERAMEQAGVKVSLQNLRTFPCVRRKERDVPPEHIDAGAGI